MTVATTLLFLVIDAILGILLSLKTANWDFSAFSIQKLPGVAENAVLPLFVGLGGSFLAASLASLSSPSPPSPPFPPFLGSALQAPTIGVVVGLVAALGVRALADIRDKVAKLLA
jgi:hypothetical protein